MSGRQGGPGRTGGLGPAGRWVPVLLGLVLTAVPPAPGAAEGGRPEILQVSAPARVRVGARAELRVLFRAPQANVAALVQVVEDLEGPLVGRATWATETSVVARAFGVEAGELVVPVTFARPGWKRVTLTLLTDEREASDPATVELEAVP